MRWGVILALGAIGLTTSGCKKEGRRTEVAGGEVGSVWSPDRPPTVLGVPSATVSRAIEARLASDPPAVLSPDRWKHVRRLYTAYGNTPLWLAANGFDADRSSALLRALVDANTDALRLDAYPLDALIAAVSAVRQADRPSAEQLAAADVLLTSAYVALAEDLLSGQLSPRALTQDWHINPHREQVDSAVARSLREPRLDSAIAHMRPQDPDYAALRQALAQFRTIVARGRWPTVPPGRTLKPGDTDAPARLAALRQRLRLGPTGGSADDASAGTSEAAPAAAPAPPAVADTGAARGRPAGVRPDAVYDHDLAGLVATFQAHYGIAVDSVLGPETVSALNVPAAYRLGQIAANLERYRWLPRAFGDRYIVVNVPAFRVEAHDGGRKALEMKVVVGEEYEGKRTPVFSDSMETVVFRPYWLIPPDIQTKETEPKIAADPGYMAANDLEYYRDGAETRIRQRPGPKNSLGLMKFLFPNSFNIYLHDTPEGELFDKDVRAFSHGCIRLEKPAELAQWVLGWSAEDVQAAAHGKSNRSVRLPRKIPVYIIYATAYQRDGRLYFGNDLYSRDEALVQAVWGGVSPNADALRQLDALRRLMGS